ncbi:MAG: cyclophilin-like fold protein [Nitrospinae bacterium]|nr:cyclophilin-like fold protein [Nitrospinota bacterium]
MSRKIQITIGNLSMEAELTESGTAHALWEALPIRGAANVWGEEIYFQVPVEAPLEDSAREEMEVGEIAYWPPGSAFCIFFGRTPASVDDAPRAASPVNPLGKVAGDPKDFLNVRSGEEVLLERTP